MTTPMPAEPAAPIVDHDDGLGTDRLYRVSTALYRGLVEHGLVDPDAVSLVDGVLVTSTPGQFDDYYRMPLEVYRGAARLGLLGPDDRVELLDGLLVEKMTRGTPHIVSTKLLVQALQAILPPGWHLGKEDPMELPTGPTGHASVPEPDVLMLRGSIRDYAARTPGPGDVPLVVEVAESSLGDDRKKMARYAWVGIPSAWIVNLVGRQVEVYAGPSGPAAEPGYGERRAYGPGESVPVVLDGVEAGRIEVDRILP